MKKFTMVLFAVACALAPLSAQNINTVTYVQDLAKKDAATAGDAVRMFVLQSGQKFSDFTSGVETLKSSGILPEGNYTEDDSLRRGLLALMSARYLKINDSVWYVMFGTERYAYAACVSDKLMKGGLSASETVTGPELIEVMGAISSRTEGSDE